MPVEVLYPQRFADDRQKLEVPARLHEEFLEGLDSFVKTNLDSLTCHDIWSMYSLLGFAHTSYRSNAGDFTGYSELLVFRVLWHVLGGDFEPAVGSDGDKPITYVCRHSRLVKLAQGTAWSDRTKPDIRIVVDDRLWSVVEIKICAGADAIKATLKKLRSYRRQYKPELQALVLCYNALSTKRRSGVLELMEQFKRKNGGWFEYGVLEKDDRLLADVLRVSLGLERLAALGVKGHRNWRTRGA